MILPLGAGTVFLVDSSFTFLVPHNVQRHVIQTAIDGIVVWIKVAKAWDHHRITCRNCISRWTCQIIFDFHDLWSFFILFNLWPAIEKVYSAVILGHTHLALILISLPILIVRIFELRFIGLDVLKIARSFDESQLLLFGCIVTVSTWKAFNFLQ